MASTSERDVLLTRAKTVKPRQTQSGPLTLGVVFNHSPSERVRNSERKIAKKKEASLLSTACSPTKANSRATMLHVHSAMVPCAPLDSVPMHHALWATHPHTAAGQYSQNPTRLFERGTLVKDDGI